MVVDGRHRRGADLLLDRYTGPPGLTLVSAAHGLVEALSALRRLTRQNVLTPAEGEAAVQWLRAFDLVLDPTAARAARIWGLRTQMSAYDAAYAACAEALGCSLVTVDDRLCRACATVGIEATDLDDIAALFG